MLWVSYRDLFGLLYRQGPTQGELVIRVTLSSPQGYNFPVPKLISKVRRVMDAHRFDDVRQDVSWKESRANFRRLSFAEHQTAKV